MPFLGGGAYLWDQSVYSDALCWYEIDAYLNAVQNENRINDNISNSLVNENGQMCMDKEINRAKFNYVLY